MPNFVPRKDADDLALPFFMSFDIPEAADADAVHKLFASLWRMRILKVEVIMPAGLAEDTTNAVLLALKKGSTVIASHNTDSDLSVPDASIPADTSFEIGLTATLPDRIVSPGDVVSWGVDESGTTTVPAHRLNLWCKLV